MRRASDSGALPRLVHRGDPYDLSDFRSLPSTWLTNEVGFMAVRANRAGDRSQQSSRSRHIPPVEYPDERRTSSMKLLGNSRTSNLCEGMPLDDKVVCLLAKVLRVERRM